MASSSTMFSEKDYQNGNGMITAIWGPPMWHFLHTMSFNYPVSPTKEDKDAYEDYIKALRWVLPCRYCRENYAKNLKSAGWKRGVMKNRDTFSRFVYRLHNEVNKQLGKRTDMSYEAVRERYETYRSRCLSKEELAAMLKKHRENGCVHPLFGESRRSVITIKRKSECRGMRSSIQDKCSVRRSRKRRSRSRKSKRKQ
jgi:hypothetical protein